jgi:formate-dependent nitrite reductase membrane component NrfD
VTAPAVRLGAGLPPDILSRVNLNARATEPQDSWGWHIAGYLYLGGLGAGAFAVAVLLDWCGFHLTASSGATSVWARGWPQLLLYWGPLVTAAGASLLIFHLGKNWHLFLTASRNPRTSWLARGFLILSGFIVCGLAVLAVAVLLPGWAGRIPIIWRFLQALGLVFALGTAIYTGILLKSMKYIPAWNVPQLPFLFLASALSTGSMGVLVAATAYRLKVADTASTAAFIHAIDVSEPVILACEATLLVLYLRHLAKGKPEGVLSAKMLLSGSLRYRFWVGVVCGALVLPFVLDAVNLGIPSNVLGLVGAATVLVAGFALRLAVLGIGIKERPPLYALSRWRAESAPRAAASESESATLAELR